MIESVPIWSIINTVFYNVNEAEILAIAQSQLVQEWNPQPVQLIGCVLVQGADLTQMNTLPEIVVPEPRLPGEIIVRLLNEPDAEYRQAQADAEAAYELRTAAINMAELNKVISASPHKVMIINSLSDFHLVARQHGGLIPVGGA